jgi:hypothetical protein
VSLRDHRAQHEKLHRALDELVACFLLAHPEKRPSTTTVLELIEWSHRATIEPMACGTAATEAKG